MAEPRYAWAERDHVVVAPAEVWAGEPSAVEALIGQVLAAQREAKAYLRAELDAASRRLGKAGGG